MKTKRQRFWRCAWCENDWDPMGLRYAWCKNEKCPHMQCNCRTVMLMKHCPWFKKADNKGVLVEVTEDDKKEITDFIANNIIENPKRKTNMQEKNDADNGRKYNSMKNKKLAEELKKFMNGKYEENESNETAFRKLLGVIVGRLNTL